MTSRDAIFAKGSRKNRTPDVEVDGYNLWEEVLCWQDLPVPNPFDNDHYLPATETRVHIDTKGVSLDALKQFIPTSKGDSEEQKAVKYSKTLDKGIFLQQQNSGQLSHVIVVV